MSRRSPRDRVSDTRRLQLPARGAEKIVRRTRESMDLRPGHVSVRQFLRQQFQQGGSVSDDSSSLWALSFGADKPMTFKAHDHPMRECSRDFRRIGKLAEMPMSVTVKEESLRNHSGLSGQPSRSTLLLRPLCRVAQDVDLRKLDSDIPACVRHAHSMSGKDVSGGRGRRLSDDNQAVLRDGRLAQKLESLRGPQTALELHQDVPA